MCGRGAGRDPEGNGRRRVAPPGKATAAARGPVAASGSFLVQSARVAEGAVVTITGDPDPDEPAVLNAGRLWSGGIATAVVAALIVVVGVYITRAILNIPVLAPGAAGDLGTSATIVYAVFAAACALLATGLLHLLLLGAPRPMTFFVWITALADLVAITAPFGQTGPLVSKVFTAIINLIVGVAVISLLSGVARSAIRPVQPGASESLDDRPAVPGDSARTRWPGDSAGMRWEQERR
jgi:hypothetical protein